MGSAQTPERAENLRSQISDPKSSCVDLGMRKLAFFETLIEMLPPKSVSDRTCFRRVADWLAHGVRDGRFEAGVFATALLYAREATIGQARNRNAVFMSILRKELGYGR